MSHWDFSGPPPAGHGGENDKYGEFAHSDDFEGGAFTPVSYERDTYGQPRGGAAPRQEAAPSRGRSAAVWPDESWPPRLPSRRRPARLIAGAVVVAVAVAAGLVVLLTRPHSANPAPGAAGVPSGTSAPTVPGSSARSATRAPASPAASAAERQPVTVAQAAQILGHYTTANNKANAARSRALLTTIEAGSSYAIDAGMYRTALAERQAPGAAFGPEQTLFYIPREPVIQYPHWFVAQVVNARLAAPRKIDGIEYMLFTQGAPGAPWRNVAEPYVLSGRATPQVAVGADDLATPVSVHTTMLAVSPTAIARLTASSLDGAKGGPVLPGNLADRLDLKFWRKRLPTATVTGQHTPGHGQVYGLRTTDGGALLFYADKALLKLIPPAGKALHLTIPGFFTPSQALRSAQIVYVDQFATYVPPRGRRGLRIVGDYSGITARAK